MQALRIVPSSAPPSATEVRVGSGAVAGLDRLIERRTVLLVADVALDSSPWLLRIRRSLELAGPCHVATIAGGEDAKRAAVAESLWDRWVAAGAGRDSVVIAVGGGSVTDVAGFAAACFLRGVPWIAVPTTVLAMADAAIGGKTGVNLGAGKNLAGAVHHPLAVLADLDVLATLPDADYADGWAEVVKAGVIADAALLDACERDAARLVAREPVAVEGALVAAIRVKADVVASDSVERSRREILNFGHTAGHALERAVPGLSHGRAVALGMAAEARLAIDRGRLPAATDSRILAACRGLGIRCELAAPPDEALLAAALGVDKKRRAGQLRVALPVRLGAHSDEPGVAIAVAEVLGAIAAVVASG